MVGLDDLNGLFQQTILWFHEQYFIPTQKSKALILVLEKARLKMRQNICFFPLFLPLCVHVCGRELLWWAKGRKNCDFFPHTTVTPLDAACSVSSLYMCAYLCMTRMCLQSLLWLHVQGPGMCSPGKWQPSKARELILWMFQLVTLLGYVSNLSKAILGGLEEIRNKSSRLLAF